MSGSLAVCLHLSPSCVPLSPSCLPLNPHTAQLSAPSSFSPQLFLNCVPLVSELPPRCGLAIVSLSFEFETVIAFGLHSWVHCVRLSGCLSLLASVPLCLPLWLVVSDSLDFSSYCICFPGFPSRVSHSGVSGSLDACLHWFLFACLPVWLSTPGGVRLSRYLSLLVSFHLFPALASGVRLSGCLLFAVTCFTSCFSYHLIPDLHICLTTHLSSIISLPQRWCLILLPACLCACLPSFVSDQLSPTSWVFPCICSPTGGVLFLLQHAFVCD